MSTQEAIENTSAGCRKQSVRSAVIRATAFGAGFAAVLVIAAGVAPSKLAKEKPWNSKAISARFIEFSTLGQTGIFRYSLSNHSANDFSVSNESVKIHFKQDTYLRSADGLSTIPRDVFLPAGQQIELDIVLPLVALDPQFAVLDAGDRAAIIKHLSELPPGQDAKVHRLVREELKKLDGFVLFDRSLRIKLDLPRGW